jgi:glutathione S-transferase
VDDAAVRAGARVIRLETTARCGRTPDVVLALEELGVAYELVQQSDGHFTETYGRMGPLLRDADIAMFEPPAMLRHLARKYGPNPALPEGPAELAEADAWMDYVYSQLRPALSRLGAQRSAPGGGNAAVTADELGRLTGVLKVADKTLRDREYLLGRFTLADCTLSLLPMLPRLGLDLSPYPGVAAYRERLMARPAFGRMTAKGPPPGRPAPSPGAP